MTYSIDLRERVTSFVLSGGSKAEASRTFSVSVMTVHNWCSMKDLTPKKHGRRRRKLDWAALYKDIQLHPDKTLKERASDFNVRINSIWYACKQLGISHKKKSSLSAKELQ